MNPEQDSRVYDVISDGYVDINLDSLTESRTGVHEVTVRLNRKRNPIDTESTSFKLNITVLDPVDCAPNLTLPTTVLSEYIYYLGNNESLGILDTGTQNGNCGFDLSFLDRQTGLALPLDIFTVTATTFTKLVPEWWHYRSVATYPSLSWQTSDVSHAYKTYHLKIEMVDHLVGASSAVSLPFDIHFWDNPCDGTW